MKIGLIGYGKMGKVIERIALERGHTIVFKSNSTTPFSEIDRNGADVAIEFTKPELALEHIKHSLNSDLPVVVGTTGWNESLAQVENWVKDTNGSLVYASNFSIGVNLFFKMNEMIAKIMQKHDDYKVSLEEIHHLQKLDAPSGTAITTAEGIINNYAGIEKWNSALNEAPEKIEKTLPITALRQPDVPGTHTVYYDSTIDQISLSHVAHNRDGFALGAVLAAEFLFNKKGIYTMSDVLSL